MKRHIILLAFLGAPQIHAQLAFEVASIKPSTTLRGVRGGCHGIDSTYGPQEEGNAPPLGRCVITDGRLSHFINIAWQLSNMQTIKSGPDWIARGSDRFNIEAKAEDPRTATEEQLRQMLQALLIERFQMKFHFEANEKSGYALVVGKKGFKIRDSIAEEARNEVKGVKPVPGRPVLLNLHKYSMKMLANTLSQVGPGPVVDKTGLPGVYDFKLSWDENAGPSIFTAVQDQLGLRLESQKVPVPQFVIDSAQKPGAN